nr:MAG TPA: hypothetical protein [Caudoviricetes sp.]
MLCENNNIRLYLWAFSVLLIILGVLRIVFGRFAYLFLLPLHIHSRYLCYSRN